MKDLAKIFNSLIIQSKTDNLKWSSYPKEFLGRFYFEKL